MSGQPYPIIPPALPDDRHSTDFILGRLLALTASIDEKVGRLIWRNDALELRVEILEKAIPSRIAERVSALENAQVKTSWYTGLGDKFMYGALGALGVYVFKVITTIGLLPGIGGLP